MKYGPDISLVAHLLGDPARANMVMALMSGQALSAAELAREGGVAPSTATGHLAKLVEAGLLIKAANRAATAISASPIPMSAKRSRA